MILSNFHESMIESVLYTDAPKIFNTRNQSPKGYFVPIEVDFNFYVPSQKDIEHILFICKKFEDELSNYEGIYLYVGERIVTVVEGFKSYNDAKSIAKQRKTVLLCVD